MANMTAKQKLFCDEYLVDLNATQAAIRAGYSKKTATVIAAENLRKPNIQEYIQKRLAEKEDALIAKQDEVLKYLTAVMRRELKEVAVVTTMEKKVFYAPDEKGTMRKNEITKETPVLVEYPAKLSDANKAADLLGKRWGIWDKKQDEGTEVQDDGFLDAIRGEVAEVWQQE
jgi:phage terminase small subunit